MDVRTLLGQSGDLPNALLSWIKHFPVAAHVTGWDDLADGKIIWAVLGQLNPSHFRGLSPLPGRSTWSTDGWINLLHIDRRVTEYIFDSCKELPHLMQAHLVDLQRVSTDGDGGANANRSEAYTKSNNTVRLLTYVFLAGVYSEESNHRVVEIIQAIGHFYAEVLKTEIDRLQSLDEVLSKQPASVAEPAPVTASSVQRDPELEREERLIKAISQNRELESQISALTAQLDQSRRAHDSLRSRAEDAENRLQHRSQVSESNAFANLKEEHERDRDVIAELEMRLSTTNMENEQLEKRVRALGGDAITKQELHDQIQLLKAENGELANSVKVNDNLRKKIQSLQEALKTADGLRKRLDEAHTTADQLEQARTQLHELQTKHAGMIEILSNGEKELFTHRTAKMHLQHELDTLSLKYNQQLEIQARQEDQIRELESRVEDFCAAPNTGTLDREMDDRADDGFDDRPGTRSSAVGVHPQSVVTSSVVDEKLRKLNSSLQSRLDRLEADYLGLLEENLTIERHVQSLVSEHSQASYYQDLERKWTDSKARISDYSNRLTATEAEVEQLRQRVGDDDVVECVKSAQSLQLETVSRLQVRTQNQDRLIERALVMLLKLRLPYDETVKEADIDLVRRQVQFIRNLDPVEKADEAADGFAVQLGTQLADYSRELQTCHLTIKSQGEEIQRLKRAQDDVKPAIAPVEAKPMDFEQMVFYMLQNKLITAAWYRVIVGIVQPHIQYSRPRDSNKGWLGQARVSVDLPQPAPR